MELLQTIIIIISAIVLFIHGLQNFSKEIQNVGADKLKNLLGSITRTRIGGFLLGSLLTATIQSSTAVSVLTVSLVDSGVLTFRDSLAIFLGANVGTTTTAWIISLNSDLIGPFFIVLGTLISIIPTRISIAGKSLFYFGFIFFSLDLINEAIYPIRDNPILTGMLMKASNPFLGIIYGIIITVIMQSSSVVTGLTVILTSQNIITIDIAIPIIMGANAGTTSTALIAGLKLSDMAKLSSLSNFIFSFGSVIIMFPFVKVLERTVVGLSDNPTIQIAFSHLIFNLVASLLFLVFLSPIHNLLTKHRWYKAHIKKSVPAGSYDQETLSEPVEIKR